MKRRGNSHKWTLLGVIWLMLSIHGMAQAVKIAVASDPSLANLVDVTTGELSKNADLSVLDRADLNKLGKEQALQSVLDSKDFSAVRLLPADGLVLLRAVTKNGKTSVFARLVAVQLGVILREVALPDGADPSTQAEAISVEFTPYWAKLSAIQKGKIESLSLLGLRFDVDSPENREMERQINTLLATRLSAEPDILVLERWRLNDVLFEKTLSPQQPSPFWTGSSLIDGGMRWSKENNRIDVSLRLRSTQGPEVSISDGDSPENMLAFVGRLAAKIHSRPFAQGTWKPTDEATHFSQLGKWCLDNLLFEEGAEALESAIALGDNSRATHLLLVKAYALQASPDGLTPRSPETDNYRSEDILPDSLPQRVAAVTQAALLAREYMQSNKDFSSPKWTLEDPVDLSVPVLHTSLQILRLAYAKGLTTDHADEMSSLRHEAQKLIDVLGDKLLLQPPSRERGTFLDDRAYYAGLWHDKPEETLAFYREILNGNPTDGKWVREILFRTSMMHEPYLDGEGEAFTQSTRDFGPPWIVAWDGQSPDQIKMLWQKFIQELAALSDPLLQADALKFELASDRTAAARREVVARFLAFLNQHTSDLSGPRGPELTTGFDAFFYGISGSNGDPASFDAFVSLYLSLFKQHVTLPATWINEMSRLIYDKTPTETAKSLLNGLNDYSQWYQTQSPQDGEVAHVIDQVRRAIYQAKPELVPASPPTSAAAFLTVNHLWDNRSEKIMSGPNPNDLKGFGIDGRTIVTEGNSVWFIGGAPRKIYCIDSTTLQVVSAVLFPDNHTYDPQHLRFPSQPVFFGVTPQWLVTCQSGQVRLCSRSDSQWQTLDLPPSYYKPEWVNQQLYLIYDAFGIRGSEHDPNGLHSPSSGLIRVNLPEGTTENLISSRRIPPQSELDGKVLGVALDLWVSQAGLTLAFNHPEAHLQVYASPLGTKSWSLLTSNPNYCHIKTTSGGAVIGTAFNIQGFSQIIGINHGGTQILLSNPSKVQPDDKATPEWNCPEEIRTMVSPVMRGDDLCLLYNDPNKIKDAVTEGTQCALYYFSKGQKDGIKIPLAFDFKQMKDSDAAKVPMVRASFEDLRATDSGLIIEQPLCGFWVIPWSDIDAYRSKAHRPASSASPN